MTQPQGRNGLDRAELLEQVSWIRRLANALVADRDLAEDLVQETCVVALQHAPRETGKLRQWLAEVLRNALRQHARGHGRRVAREGAAARPEALEGVDHLVERARLQRELVGAVLDLEEPYRATVLLRFFEELPPREIARRTGTPLATVNSRLQRALARLRERLDRDHHAWATVLLPWARSLDVPLTPPTLVPLVMKTKITLLAGAAALAATAFVLWRAAPDAGIESARAPAAAARLERPSTPTGAPPPAAPATRGARTPVSAPARSGGPAAPVPEAAPWTVRLRVLDAEGQAMAGIEIQDGEEGPVVGRSGAGGWCVFETRAESLFLCAADPRWVTIHEGSPSRTSSLDPVLVLAPAIQLAGFVVDPEGRALPGASVRFDLPQGFHTRFTEVLEASRTQGWRARCDPEGRFAFERVPAVAGCALRAVAAGYDSARLEAPLASASDLEIVLRRPELPLAGVLRGTVIDLLGAPVPEARVGLGLLSVVSDEDGRFELALARAVTAEQLQAVKAGYLPARMDRPGEPGPDRSGWPDEVVLVLGGPSLSIQGVVVDAEGAPVPRARVWLHDPTPGAPIGIVPTTLEPLMAGAAVPASALESESRLPAEDGDSFIDWHTQPQDPSLLWNWVETDSTGAFEFPGLDARNYKLDVLGPESLQVTTSESIPAGARAVRVQLDPPDVFEPLRGVVHGEDGEVLADVSVTLFRPMIDARARFFGGNSQIVVIQPAGTATTDAKGRFEFKSVPRHGAQLSLRGDAVVPRSVEVTEGELDIELEVRCHLEVVVRLASGRFDEIAVRDRQGGPLDLIVLTEGSMNAWTSMPLVDGRSGVLSVSSRASELVLLKGGVEVETRPLDLVPGDVNRVEL